MDNLFFTECRIIGEFKICSSYLEGEMRVRVRVFCLHYLYPSPHPQDSHPTLTPHTHTPSLSPSKFFFKIFSIFSCTPSGMQKVKIFFSIFERLTYLFISRIESYSTEIKIFIIGSYLKIINHDFLQVAHLDFGIVRHFSDQAETFFPILFCHFVEN